MLLMLLVVHEVMETLNSRGAACCARILQRTASALSSWGVMSDNDDDDEIFNSQRVGTETAELTKPIARVTNLREEDKTCRDRYLG